MEEINLKDLWKYFRGKISILILLIFSCTAIAAVYAAFIEQPVYKSSTTIVLTGINNSSDTSISQTDITINQKLVSSYSEIIKSRKIIDQVITNLGLDLSYDDLSKMISVVNVDDTELLKITVSSNDPHEAQNIANEITEVFSKEIKEIYNIENVTTIDTAEYPTSSSNKSLIIQLLYGFLIGAVLGCVVIFIMFNFDTTIKSEKDIEDTIGLPVIGTVSFSSDSHQNSKESKK